MENTNKMSPEEVSELRKALTDLGMEDNEIDSTIEKAMKDKEESSTEDTIAEKASKSEETKDDVIEEVDKKGDEKEIEKNMEEEDLEKSYSELKAKQQELQKSIDEMEMKMGKKKEATIEKSVEVDFEKSFGERFEDIEKSLTAKFEGKFNDLEDIIKGLESDLEEAKETIDKIGNSPIATKAVFTKANFFEKGVDNDIEGGKELSISNDRDEIIKGMQDMLSKETDSDIKEVLENGISDITINRKPTDQGISAIALFARKNKVTLVQ